jgi:D-glycero-D-manno-heptose 1,7-bisphosphate phosphatase
MGDPAQPGNWSIVPPGIWLDIRAARAAEPRPALFLDRDGVVIHDRGFITTPAEVALLPGAAALIRAANAAGAPVLVATNQSGIDRALFGWDAFAAIEARIAALLAAAGAAVDATAACPFHPDFTAGYGAAHAHYRKPGAGMLFALSEALGLTLSESWMVGDQPRDIEAARNAGLAGGILLSDPAGSAALDGLATPTFAVQTARSPREAAELLRATLFAGR